MQYIVLYIFLLFSFCPIASATTINQDIATVWKEERHDKKTRKHIEGGFLYGGENILKNTTSPLTPLA